MAGDQVKASFGKPGEHVVSYVKPGDQLVLENVDFNSVEIDILGSDVIMVDPATGAKKK